MKIKVYVNLVCDSMLNSGNNINFTFEVDRPYLPQKELFLDGFYAVIEESVYDIVTEDAKIYCTCYYPRNKATTAHGKLDVKEAQSHAMKLIESLNSHHHLGGTYTMRNCGLPVDGKNN